MTNYAIYGGTKTFNLVFANNVVTQFAKSEKTQGLVDGIVL